MKLNMLRRSLAAAALSCLLAQSAQAGIVINIFEEGGFIKTEFAGYINLGSVSQGGNATTPANTGSFNSSAWGFRSYASAPSLAIFANLFTAGDANFGTGSNKTLVNGTAGQVTGDSLGLNGTSTIYLPQGYQSGTFLSGGWTSTNPITSTGNLRSLGVGNTSSATTDGGSFVRYYGDLVAGDPVDGQFVRVNVTYGSDRPTLPTDSNSNNVPAPATPLLVAAGLLGGGVSRRLVRRAR